MNLKNKRILVTGGAGFIGSHLIEKLLQKDAKVSIIMKPNSNLVKIFHLINEIKIYECDLLDGKNVKNIIEIIKPQIIYHLASHVDVSRSYEMIEISQKNITMMLNLITALGNKFELFINTGTCEEYGIGNTPFMENQLAIPVSPYSSSKLACTGYAQMLYRSFNLPIVTVRPFLTFGPRQTNNMLIPSTIMGILNKNQEILLTKGEQTRDFVYVEDLVEGYLSITPNESGEIINLGSGKEYSIKKIVLTIGKLLDVDEKILKFDAIPYRKGEAMSFYSDSSKAKKLIGWETKTTLEEGLRKTVQWYKELLDKGELVQWMKHN